MSDLKLVCKELLDVNTLPIPNVSNLAFLLNCFLEAVHSCP
jgi:hypothetical protein